MKYWPLFLHYARLAHVRPWHLFVPLALALLLAAAESASYGLLLPLSQGAVENSMSGVWDRPGLSLLRPFVPEALFGASHYDAIMTVALIGLVFALRLFSLAFEYARKVFLVARDQRYDVAIRKGTLERLLMLGRRYFDERAAGETHTLLDWSSSLLSMLRAADNFIVEGVRFAGKVTVMLVMSWQMTVAVACAFPLTQFLIGRLAQIVERLSRRRAELSMQVEREVFDIFATIPIVKAVSFEAETVTRYSQALDTLRGASLDQERVHRLSAPVEHAILILVMLAAVAALILSAGSFRPGHLAMLCGFFLVAHEALPNFLALNRLRLHYIEESPRLERLAELHFASDRYIIPSGTRPFVGLSKGISVTGLHFAYRPEIPVLRGIDAFFAAGKMTAIVGESGGGKTTFVDLLARFYDCPPGSIRFDDVDLREISVSALHEHMAIASQEVWLLNRTLRENLVFGLDAPPEDQRLYEVLESVGLGPLIAGLPQKLDTELGERGVKVSGGEKQRLALARGLLRNADILILDEATAALDSLTERRVQSAIDDLSRGRTVIAIAHRLSTIRMADHIIVIEAGRVVEQGTWDELSAAGGHFARLLSAQQSGAEG